MEQIPNDITLAELRRRLIETPTLGELMGLVKLGRVMQIRFIRVPEETDLPDAMLLREFQALAGVGLAKLVIDDEGQGGFRIDAPTRELQ